MVCVLLNFNIDVSNVIKIKIEIEIEIVNDTSVNDIRFGDNIRLSIVNPGLYNQKIKIKKTFKLSI